MLESLFPFRSKRLRDKVLSCVTYFSTLILSLSVLERQETTAAALGTKSLKISQHSRGAMLKIYGGSGKHYAVEHSPLLSSEGAWRPLAGFTLQSDTFELVDPALLFANQGFYRLTELPNPIQLGFASNFRLIDDQDNLHELFYNTDRRAIVLVFVNQETVQAVETREMLADLKLKFADDNILMWLVNSSPDADRNTISSAAKTSQLRLPYLHDRALLVAREFGVRSDLEAVAIDPISRSIFYQGAILGFNGSAENSVPYLEQALRQFLGGESVRVPMTPATGAPVNLPAMMPVSYSQDIASIIADKCIRCHSPGNIGPFSMTSHAVVADWSYAIKEQVLGGRMPPWHADPEYGEFANDLSLTPLQKASLIQWINEGALRGEGPDPLEELFTTAPPQADYPLTWPPELGEPDYIVTISKQTLPAEGEIEYRYETVPVDLPDDVWLRAAVVLPGNASVVHHVLVSPGSEYRFERFFTAFTPGTRWGVYPEGSGKRLQRVKQISMELHYNSTGQPETDQTQIGLYFHKTQPASEMMSAVPLTGNFNIPPGTKEYRPNNATYTFTRDAMLHTFQPHMHVRGLKMKYEARYPDGTREVLLNVPKYDFEWQTKYVLAKPKFMPRGTRITISGAFDNSPLNPYNPDPTRGIRWGLQTSGEMFIGFMGYVNSQ